MRVGRSPAAQKINEELPAEVTVCVLVCIPNQVGYYKHRFEVLKCCLESIVKHTPRDSFELLVFDNGSCAEVRNYLQQLHEQGTITYLLLSSRNLGKVNAFKAIFGSAPGQIVAYSDDDVFFYPGWLDAHLEILRAFPGWVWLVAYQ
jgi:glycosyltransferase involved in cell wall biosynthesis